MSRDFYLTLCKCSAPIVLLNTPFLHSKTIHFETLEYCKGIDNLYHQHDHCNYLFIIFLNIINCITTTVLSDFTTVTTNIIPI